MKHENKGLYSGILLLAIVVGLSVQATPPIPPVEGGVPAALINPVTISLAAIGASMEAVSNVNDACTRIPELNATREAANRICTQYLANARAMKDNFPNYICGGKTPAWRILSRLTGDCLRAAWDLREPCKPPEVSVCGAAISGSPIGFFYNPFVMETNSALSSCRTARDGFIQTVNAAVTGAQQQLAVGCVIDKNYQGEGDAHAARQISTDGGDTRTH